MPVYPLDVPVVQARKIVLHTQVGRYFPTNPQTGLAGWRPGGLTTPLGRTGNTKFIRVQTKRGSVVFAVRESHGRADVFRVHPGHRKTVVIDLFTLSLDLATEAFHSTGD